MQIKGKDLMMFLLCGIFMVPFSLSCSKREASDTAGANRGVASKGVAENTENGDKLVLPEKQTAKEYYDYGIERIKKGAFDEAIAAWEKALEIDPKMLDLYDKLGKAYYTLGKFNKAGEMYRKKLSYSPNDPMIYYSLGIVYRLNEQFEDAVNMQKKALSLNPEFASAYNELGLTYCKQRKFDEAIAAHKKALELDPDLGTAHNYLGVVYLLKGMSKEAEEEFEKFKKYEATSRMYPSHGAPAAH